MNASKNLMTALAAAVIVGTVGYVSAQTTTDPATPATQSTQPTTTPSTMSQDTQPSAPAPSSMDNSATTPSPAPTSNAVVDEPQPKPDRN